jgi:hypothetical protein
MSGLPASLTLNRDQNGCPTLAALLLLRLGWEGSAPSFPCGSTREVKP